MRPPAVLNGCDIGKNVSKWIRVMPGGGRLADGRRRARGAETGERGSIPTVEPRTALMRVWAPTETVRGATEGVGAAVVHPKGCIGGRSGFMHGGLRCMHGAWTCMRGGLRCMRGGLRCMRGGLRCMRGGSRWMRGAWRCMRAPWRCMRGARRSARGGLRVGGRALEVVVAGHRTGGGDAGIDRAVREHGGVVRCDVDRGGRWSARDSGRLARCWSPLKGLLRERLSSRSGERVGFERHRG